MNEIDRERRYWAIRTDKNNADLLFREVTEGRLRQGWGYDLSQDLKLIQKERNLGGKWWERLSDVQIEAWRNYRMLGEGDDSVRIGDILLLPNLPQPGYFCMAEAKGNYFFQILPLRESNDTNNLGGDYVGLS